MGKYYKDFAVSRIDKAIDYDGSWGVQCVDAANDYSKWLGGKYLYCGSTGYAQDIATQKYTNGILDWCIDIGLKAELKAGDICVWGECWACPASHVAIFDHEDAQGNCYFLGEQQDYAHSPYCVHRIPVNGIIGVFRPKALTDPKPTPKPTPSKTEWYDGVCKIGQTVKSISCDVKKNPATKTLTSNGCAWVPTLGGWLPFAHIGESDDTKDGKKDGLIKEGSRVYLLPCVVEDVDEINNFVMVHGYWVDPTPLRIKK